MRFPTVIDAHSGGNKFLFAWWCLSTEKMTTQQVARYSCFVGVGYNLKLPSKPKTLEFYQWDTGQVSCHPIIKDGIEQLFCMSKSRFGWVFCRLEEQCQGREEK